jgi:hypothetical protein
MATIVHSFSVMPGNAGPGQTFTLDTPGRYQLIADPPGNITGLDWLASAPAKPERWARWQPFNPDDGEIFVAPANKPQTFRVIYGPVGAVVELYFEEQALQAELT